MRDRTSRRTVHWHWDADGSLVLRARLDPDEGAAVLKALEAAQSPELALPADAAAARHGASGKADEAGTEHDSQAATGASSDEGHRLMTAAERASSRADALVAMAEVYIAHHAPVYGADVYQVVVHVRDDAPAHVEDGPAIPVETAMRLSCDTSVYCVHEDRRGAVLDLGRVTSKVRRPLRRALWLRDGGCRFPGCGRRRRVDAHHVKHWSKGGRTCLANLCLLCRRHHTLVHEGGFSLIMDSQGQPVFRTPEGTELLEFPALPGSGRAPREWHQQAVAPGAVETRWGGEKVDLDYVVSVVCQPKAQRSLEVTGDEPDRAKRGDGEPDQAGS